MRHEHPLETKMRMSKFPSEAAAQAALKDDALVPGYLIDLFRERRLIELRMDGSVAGLQKVRKSPTAGKDWGDSWPARDAVVKSLSIQREGMTLTELKEQLLVMDEPAGHWATQHALRKLISDKVVTKIENRYVLVGGTSGTSAPALASTETTFKSAWDAVTAKARTALLASIERMGPDAEKVSEHLGAVKMEAWGLSRFSQPFIDWVVKANKTIDA